VLQRSLVLLFPLLLAGCLSLDPDYQRPTSPVPANLPQGAAYHAATDKLSLGYPDIPWRDYVVDPKLRQVVTQGLSSSRTLQEAIANIESARAQYGEQRSYLFPTINAGINGSRARSVSGNSEGNETSLRLGVTAYGTLQALRQLMFLRVDGFLRQIRRSEWRFSTTNQ